MNSQLVTEQQVFERLSKASNLLQRKVRDLAEEVIENRSAARPPRQTAKALVYIPGADTDYDHARVSVQTAGLALSIGASGLVTRPSQDVVGASAYQLASIGRTADVADPGSTV